VFAHTFFFFTYYICGLEHIKNLKSLDILSKSKRKKKVHTLEKSIVYLFSIDFYNFSYIFLVYVHVANVCVYFFLFFYCETVIMSSLSFLCKTKYCLQLFFFPVLISQWLLLPAYFLFFIYIYKKWYTPFFFRLDEFPNNSTFFIYL